jgi:hypothetical protein
MDADTLKKQIDLIKSEEKNLNRPSRSSIVGICVPPLIVTFFTFFVAAPG